MEPPEWISLWKEHLPLLVGAASTIFVALRILSVANFNPETAYALLQTAGTAQVILGAILAAVDIFLAIFATLFITPSISMIYAPWSTEKRVTITIALAAGAATLLFASIIFFIFLLILSVPIYFTMYRHLKGSSVSRQEVAAEYHPAISGWLIIAWAAILVFYSLAAPPWFPTERLVIDRPPPVTAYVLSDSGPYVVILLADSRRIRYLSPQSIVNRALCYNKPPGLQQSLLALLKPNRPGYPECPR